MIVYCFLYSRGVKSCITSLSISEPQLTCVCFVKDSIYIGMYNNSMHVGIQMKRKELTKIFLII